MVKHRAIPDQPISKMILAMHDSCRKPFLQCLEHVYVQGVCGVLLMFCELLLNEIGHLRFFVFWYGEAIAAVPCLNGFVKLRGQRFSIW